MPDILQNILIYGGSFVVVLSLVVFVHEFGHFQAARSCKVAIDTFSIGFGKKILGWRDKAGVEWKIGMLPLGGYVKFADDADAMSTAPVEAINDPVVKAEARRKGLFHAQPLGVRAFVVAAGPMANFIFSIAAFGLLAYIMGRDNTNYDAIPARVAVVVADTPAAAAGIESGDIIRSVDGVTIHSFRELQEQVSTAAGREVALQIEHNGQLRAASATPIERGGHGVLGVSGPLVLQSERVIERYGPLEALTAGAQRTWDMVAQTASYVAGIFSGRESGKDIAGPLGILNVSGQVATTALQDDSAATGGPIGTLALSLFALAAMLSVAVGIVNLLPIPLLDGGHLLFYAVEGVRGGKPLPPAAQEWAYRAGFAVMASLFLFATWNDITRHLPGGQG